MNSLRKMNGTNKKMVFPKIFPGHGKPQEKKLDKKMSMYSTFFDQIFPTDEAGEINEDTEAATAGQLWLFIIRILELTLHLFLPLGLILFIVVYFTIYSSI